MISLARSYSPTIFFISSMINGQKSIKSAGLSIDSVKKGADVCNLLLRIETDWFFSSL